MKLQAAFSVSQGAMDHIGNVLSAKAYSTGLKAKQLLAVPVIQYVAGFIQGIKGCSLFPTNLTCYASNGVSTGGYASPASLNLSFLIGSLNSNSSALVFVR